jgi:hypothetical protein
MAQRDKISRLPAEVRRWLDRALADGNFGGYEQLADELKQRGYDVSRSGVHRYGQRLERRLAAIKASTEAARAIAEAAPDEADHRSAAVISLVQSEMFDLLLSLDESADMEPAERVAALSRAARGIADLARASLGQKKHEAEIRRQAAADLVAAVEGEAGGGAITPERLREIVRETYGV